MCGIGAILNLDETAVGGLESRLATMNRLLAHRGPDGEGMWAHSAGHVGFAHRRLEIIDLSTGDQPMHDEAGNWITYNGEIYNYIELRREIGESELPDDLRHRGRLARVSKMGSVVASTTCAACSPSRSGTRRRGGSSAPATDSASSRSTTRSRTEHSCAPRRRRRSLPFLPEIETDTNALKDYLAFQFCLAGKTLFRGVSELLPGHTLTVQRGVVRTERYWEVQFEPDFEHTEQWFTAQLREIVEESVRFHLRADVPVGAYLSGGLDSSITAALAAREGGHDFQAFTGKFDIGQYDESRYARALAEENSFRLHETTIGASDFAENIHKVIYHLDYPVAGPGSFPQYMVSRLAGSQMKVVLGGQGGDEIFGGYARYLLAYFEQCIKAAIDGTMHAGNFIVTYESIIPQLGTLREYKPLMQDFWREGLFGELDERYFRLINRAPDLGDAVDWDALGDYSPFETFSEIFRAENVGKESYFDSMTHFDFKTLLPALLHVEDRVSMAHGLESRVPFVDATVVEFAAPPAGRREVQGRPAQAFAQARHGRPPSGVHRRTTRQDGLSRFRWANG